MQEPRLGKKYEEARCVCAKFSHSAVNSSDLETIQELSQFSARSTSSSDVMTPGNKSFNIQVPSSHECSREIRDIH